MNDEQRIAVLAVITEVTADNLRSALQMRLSDWPSLDEGALGVSIRQAFEQRRSALQAYRLVAGFRFV